VTGFRNLKKVNDKDHCAFFTHMGQPGLAHNYFVQCHDNLKNQPGQIANALEKVKDEDIKKNRVCL
jgi:hypothetical protein